MNDKPPMQPAPESTQPPEAEEEAEEQKDTENQEDEQSEEAEEEPMIHAPKDFERGPWLDPANQSYGRGKWLHASYTEFAALAHRLIDLDNVKSAFVVLADNEPGSYKEAMCQEPNLTKQVS